MKILNVELSNYRSLKQIAVRSLKTMNMLYGYNNTGKSNVLTFIELVFRRKVRTVIMKYVNETPMEQRIEEPMGWWEGEFNHPPFMYTDDKRELEIAFLVNIALAHSELKSLGDELQSDYLSKDHGTTHIVFEGTIRSIRSDISEISLTKTTINKKIAYNSAAKDDQKRYFPSSETLAGQSQTFYNLLAIFNDCVLLVGSDRYLTEEPEISKGPAALNAKNAKNWLFGYYMDSQKYAKFQEFVSFIKKYRCKHTIANASKNAWRQWPLSTGDVGFGRFGKNIELMLRNATGRFPISSYGTGVQQIIYLLAKLFFSSARIVLIEEIELNLSPTAQLELFINLKQLVQDKHFDQILFTTHSDFFNYRGDFKLYEAELSDNGYTNINPKQATGDFFKKSIIQRIRSSDMLNTKTD